MYGWSEFSPMSFILTASVPSAPAKPTFIETTYNSIRVGLQASESDNGASITHYVLEMDNGDSVFDVVSSYKQDSFVFEHTVTFANDQIVSGRVYTFRF